MNKRHLEKSEIKEFKSIARGLYQWSIDNYTDVQIYATERYLKHTEFGVNFKSAKTAIIYFNALRKWAIEKNICLYFSVTNGHSYYSMSDPITLKTLKSGSIYSIWKEYRRTIVECVVVSVITNVLLRVLIALLQMR